MTSYKAAATGFPSAARYWSYALLFVALFLAGVWHGTTQGFVLFGALNGLGAAVTRAYGDTLRARLGGAGVKAYLQNRIICCLAVIATLHYTCFTFLFFSMQPQALKILLTTISAGLSNLPASLGGSTWRALDAVPLLIAALAVTALWKADAIGSAVTRVTSALERRPRLMHVALCALTATVVLILYFEWAFQQESPPVLYMSF
jgi:hypothetical protein